MKLKFYLLGTLLLAAFLSANAGLEKKKEFHQKWETSSVETLNLINKFGEIKIINGNGSQITVDVVVTVEASSDSKAEDLLNDIEVNFSKTGGTAKAETTIENNFRINSKFSINYTVNIPSDKNLIIDNKYGNTIMDELNAKGSFNINYGNLTAVRLNGPGPGDISISLGYGKADIESISDATIDIKYSKMNVSEAGKLKIESRYSGMTLEESKFVEINSKYDTFNFEEAGTVNAVTRYTHINIVELKKALKLDSGYGGIKVEEVSAQFESIYVENSYGAVSLGISESASYNIDATCDYCDIDYNSDDFKGNRFSESHSKSIDGKIGAAATSAKVVVKSRYGGIKLR